MKVKFYAQQNWEWNCSNSVLNGQTKNEYKVDQVLWKERI